MDKITNENSEKIITDGMIDDFCRYLTENERSKNTVSKYAADVCRLKKFADGRPLSRGLMLEYKTGLAGSGYAVRSINSFIASANAFLKFMGWQAFTVKQLKMQNEVFADEDKELTKDEYGKLVGAAKDRGNLRLAVIITVICSTGIRISELEFLTVAAVNKGRMTVENKGKLRTVIITGDLKMLLESYIAYADIKSGVIFRTSGGKPVNRSNIWREMKSLCKDAGVKESKVFPHNFRHLFAKLFFALDKDIAKLADILGHSSIETTRIYLRKSTKEYFKSLQKMDVVINVFRPKVPEGEAAGNEADGECLLCPV